MTELLIKDDLLIYENNKYNSSNHTLHNISERVIRYGYLLMQKLWSLENDPMVKAGQEYVNQHIINTINIGHKMYEEKPAQYLAYVYPVREFNSLNNIISAKTDDDKYNIGSSNMFFEINYGTYENICKSYWKNIKNFFNNQLPVVCWDIKDAMKVDSAQKELKNHEISLDKKMKKIIDKYIDYDFPENVKKLELIFTKAFKEGIEKTGGIENFVKKRYNYYDKYQLLENYGIINPLLIKHFKEVTTNKFKLYKKSLQVDFDKEIENVNEIYKEIVDKTPTKLFEDLQQTGHEISDDLKKIMPY